MAKKLEKEIEKEINRQVGFNPLYEALRANDKKNLFSNNITTYFHKTGFALYDYYLGSVINVHDEDGKIIRQDPMVGQAAGVFNMIIGRSGSAKSTFTIQIAANIIRPYKHASVEHYDCENRLQQTRVEILTGLPVSDFDEGGRYHIHSGTQTLEDMQEVIVRLYVEKMKLKDQLMVGTGRVNELGKEIKIFEPTVIILDSVANIISESFSPTSTAEVNKAVELRSNTDGARDAKTIRGFLKEVLPLCKEVNIIIFAINHITSNMNMNAFLPAAKQQNNLGQDEAIPGGNALIFNSFNILKMIAKPSDDFTEDVDGFKGHIVLCEPIKSSSNQSGNARKGVYFEQVFSFKSGIDPLRSLIWYGKEHGLIEGNKPRMKFRDDESCIFSWKNIYQDANEKPIWENVKKFIIPELEKQLPFAEPQFDERSLDY